MNNFIIVTYWWGDKICPNSRRNSLNTINRPVSFKTLESILRKRCKALGLQFYGEKVDSDPGFSYKPLFIRKCLERFQKPVLYIDCDIHIHRLPELLKHMMNYEFMAFNWLGDPRVNSSFDWHTLRSSASVLFFNHTRNVLCFLNQWHDHILQSHTKDDVLLDKTFEEMKDTINYYWFPYEYFYIPKLMPKPKRIVLSHPFEHTHPIMKSISQSEKYTHVIEYNTPNDPSIKSRNRAFKQLGIRYQCQSDPPPFLAVYAKDLAVPIVPIDHDNGSFPESTDLPSRHIG
jgi:hypothetical protein